MKIYRNRKIGTHRNNKRLWLTPRVVEEAGLRGNDGLSLEYSECNDRPILVITKTDTPTCKVVDTGKGGVIDINNSELSARFADYDGVEISCEDGRITVKGELHESKIISREQCIRSRASTRQPLRGGELFSGIGLLGSSFMQGLGSAGIKAKNVFSNELDPLTAEANIKGNGFEGVFVQGDIYNLDLSLVPKLDFLVVGSPCPAFSVANTKMAKSNLTDVFHPESGTIFQPILSVINKSNPAFVLIENVRGFSGSIFDHIMTDVMRRFGYSSTERLVMGKDHGAFERRERLVRVFYSKGLQTPDLSLIRLLETNNERTFGSILDQTIGADSDLWRTGDFINKKNNDTTCHKFKGVSSEATTIPTLTASYAKFQPDTPMVSHPTKSNYLRLLTVAEHCRVRGVNPVLAEEIEAVASGESMETHRSQGSVGKAHRMLGNSVTPEVWTCVGEVLGDWILKTSKGSSRQMDLAV